MMKRATRWLIAGMALLLVATGPAVAESPAATAQWLNSIGLSYRNKPWDVDAVLKAYSVNFTRARKFKVDDMQNLRAMPRLRRVDLGHPRFGNEELAALANIPQITSLRLSRAAVTPEGLAVFDRMPQLRTLSLAGMRVSEATMAHVAKLRNLRSLDLSRATVDDASLAQLSRLPTLRRLGLSSAKGIRIEDQTEEEYEARKTFQETDPPDHTYFRMLVNEAFPVVPLPNSKIRSATSPAS